MIGIVSFWKGAYQNDLKEKRRREKRKRKRKRREKI